MLTAKKYLDDFYTSTSMYACIYITITYNNIYMIIYKPKLL